MEEKSKEHGSYLGYDNVLCHVQGPVSLGKGIKGYVWQRLMNMGWNSFMYDCQDKEVQGHVVEEEDEGKCGSKVGILGIP